MNADWWRELDRFGQSFDRLRALIFPGWQGVPSDPGNVDELIRKLEEMLKQAKEWA